MNTDNLNVENINTQDGVKQLELGGIRVLAEMMSRATMMQGGLGQSFAGNRKLYEAAGYPKSISFADYLGRYERQDVATRVVEAYPDAAWKGGPTIQEDKDPEKDTKFEKAWKDLEKDKNLNSIMRRADIMAGIGEFGIIFLGLSDVGDDAGQAKPVIGKPSLEYARPFSQANVTVKTLVVDTKDPRFGQPEMYKLKIVQSAEKKVVSGKASTKTVDKEVHWSRVIHIAPNPMDSLVYGTPKMRSVYNRLQDIETTMAGTTEALWKGGFPGIAFQMDPLGSASDDDVTEMKEDLAKYEHGLQRFLRLKGVEANTLDQQIADPGPQLEAELSLVAASTGIPKRILMGSEMAQLASSQDRLTWWDRVMSYREDIVEVFILRPFIDRLIEFKILPPPTAEEGYTVAWPEFDASSDVDKATILKLRTESMAAYIQGGLEAIIPAEIYLTKFMKMDKDEAKEIIEAAKEQIDKEAKEAEAEAKASDKTQLPEDDDEDED